jgi:hypothetical protein
VTFCEACASASTATISRCAMELLDLAGGLSEYSLRPKISVVFAF